MFIYLLLSSFRRQNYEGNVLSVLSVYDVLVTCYNPVTLCDWAAKRLFFSKKKKDVFIGISGGLFRKESVYSYNLLFL